MEKLSDENFPLHLAVMRGNVEVIKGLITNRPEVIRVPFKGESILHFCVKNNHFDSLKLIMEMVKDDDGFINSKDGDGFTILHLAVMFRQIETTSYLLSIPKINTTLKDSPPLLPAAAQYGGAAIRDIPHQQPGQNLANGISSRVVGSGTPPKRSMSGKIVRKLMCVDRCMRCCESTLCSDC